MTSFADYKRRSAGIHRIVGETASKDAGKAFSALLPGNYLLPQNSKIGGLAKPNEKQLVAINQKTESQTQRPVETQPAHGLPYNSSNSGRPENQLAQWSGITAEQAKLSSLPAVFAEPAVRQPIVDETNAKQEMSVDQFSPQLAEEASNEIGDNEEEEKPETPCPTDFLENEISLALAGIPASLDETDWLSVDCVICRKTGKVLGRMGRTSSEDDTGEATEISEADECELFAERMATPFASISLSWLHDDSEALDDLQRDEPEAYAAFTLAKLCQMQRNVLSNGERKLVAAKFSAEAGMPNDPQSLWTLARARKWLDITPEETLEELNELLCRCVAIGPSFARTFQQLVNRQSKKRFLSTLPRDVLPEHIYCPDWLARHAQNGKLVPLLRQAYSDALASTLSGQRAARIGKRLYGESKGTSPLTAAQGPSSIRGQRKASKALKMANDFAVLFAEFGIGQGFLQPKQEVSYEAKIQAAQEQRKAILASLAKKTAEGAVRAWTDAFVPSEPMPDEEDAASSTRIAEASATSCEIPGIRVNEDMTLDESALLDALNSLSLEDLEAAEDLDEGREISRFVPSDEGVALPYGSSSADQEDDDELLAPLSEPTWSKSKPKQKTSRFAFSDDEMASLDGLFHEVPDDSDEVEIRRNGENSYKKL